MHVGMMDIIRHIGSVSGIDDAVYMSADTATAQKIILLALHLLVTNGQVYGGNNAKILEVYTAHKLIIVKDMYL